LSENKLKFILPIAILAAGALITFAMLKSRTPVKTRPQSEYAPLVRVIEAEPISHRFTVRTQGTVAPRTETSLVPEVSGRIIDVSPSFASGAFFEKGDILLTIDPRDYELAVVTARSQVAQARLRLETEEAQARVAREEWKELGNGRESPLATRELQVQEARAAQEAAEAALEKAERNLGRTRIRAPFTGRVRQENADIGQYITPGVPVATIYAVDFVEIRLPIPDADLAYLDLPINYRGNPSIEAGPEVRLYADFAGQRHEWTGRIVRMEGEIDPVSRMVHAVAQVDDPYGQEEMQARPPLAVGLFVEAEILGHEVESAFVVPRSALRRDNRILIVDEENHLRFRNVDILRADRDYAVIGDGIMPGELICVSVLDAVTDGMNVRVVDADRTDRPTAAPATAATDEESDRP
jgi:multidrug efflux system membrane fusion protein